MNATHPGAGPSRPSIEERLAAEYERPADCVARTVALLREGNTVPFLARYRKEVTGGMDDELLRSLADRLQALEALEARRQEVDRRVEELGVRTPELAAAIAGATTLAELEDLYRPYRPKRKTRASIALARGLGPLADQLAAWRGSLSDLMAQADALVDPDNGVPDGTAALDGACDILAERLSDDPALRGRLRRWLQTNGLVTATLVKGVTDDRYLPYHDFREPVGRIAGHRVLAIRRGEREEILRVAVEAPEEAAVSLVESVFERSAGRLSTAWPRLSETARDAWKRLIHPSLETEIRNDLFEAAQEQAIRIFAKNLRQLLLQPPVRGRVVLGFDPAYRTGCKLAVVDATGRLLETVVIYPTPPQSRTQEAAAVLQRLVRTHGVTLVALGNGTASRESEAFLRGIPLAIPVIMVSEAGASVYSASPLGTEEFPELDATLRSAVSIARRVQDPLAELVKIDPRSIGVGQYQHDMDQKRLGDSLDGVVESCVNQVGVDLNTASPSLLARVAGLSPSVARRIVHRRNERGPFRSRKELLEVEKLGPATFRQCAGFLRIPGAPDPLDATSVHPESYPVARALMQRLGLSGPARTDAATRTPGAGGHFAGAIAALDAERLAGELGCGVPTLQDILDALARPDRDPRDDLPQPELQDAVRELSDLKPGMVLTGVVRNVSSFGAFVDLGVHQDGLVHVSEMADRYVRDPLEAVSVGQPVRVRVLSVDPVRKRISLTMKGVAPPTL